MRILHVVEAHTVHTNRIVEYQQGQGHDVIVVTLHDRVGSGPVREIPVPHWVRRLPYHHHWSGMSKVAAIARAHRPELLHGHYLSTSVLYLSIPSAAVTVGSAMGSDILIDTHAAHVRLLVRTAPNWVDRFTSVAPHVTRRMVQLGIPPDRIETFPWGVDPDIFHPGQPGDRRPVMISTRSFEPIYDVETLLKAFGHVAHVVPNATLQLFGDGSESPRLMSQARALPGGERISFQGRASPHEIAEALRGARVYVSTARSDGASASLLEAMSTGIVPVVTDIEANRNWITHGENGLLFPLSDERGLKDSLEVALADEELVTRCRTMNPRIVATRASFATSMERLERMYREGLSS